MKYIETLIASTFTQTQAFFFSEMQKALGTKAEQLLQWQAFDAMLLDVTSTDVVFLHRVELPTFELITFSTQLEFAYSAAADISQQYVGIYVNVTYDEEAGVILVYLASEDVTMAAIDTLFHVEDDAPRRTATVHPISLVPTLSPASAPVAQPNAASEPVAPSNDTPAPDVDDEPEAFEVEPPANEAAPAEDSPVSEQFNEEMLSIEQLENLDVLRKDEEATAFIRAGLVTGVEQFEGFVEFNDVTDFPMSVVYDVLALYEDFKSPPAKTEVEQIFSEDEPDTFFAEEPDTFETEDAAPAVEAEAEPVRVAPLGGERTTDNVATAIAEELISEADAHTARFAQILQDIAAQLPNDTASEITDGALVVIMSRVVPNENGVGSKDVDYNLRLTVRREMFGGVKEIDKYRLENNGESILETASLQSVTDMLNTL